MEYELNDENDIYITLRAKKMNQSFTFFKYLNLTNIFVDKEENYLVYKLDDDSSEHRIYISDDLDNPHKDIVIFIDPISLESICNFLDKYNFKTCLILFDKLNFKNPEPSVKKRFLSMNKGSLAYYQFNQIEHYDKFISSAIEDFLKKKNNTKKDFNVSLKFRENENQYESEEDSDEDLENQILFGKETEKGYYSWNFLKI